MVDFSMGMLFQAKIKGGMHQIHSYSEKLPFEDETFECVLMVDALNHV